METELCPLIEKRSISQKWPTPVLICVGLIGLWRPQPDTVKDDDTDQFRTDEKRSKSSCEYEDEQLIMSGVSTNCVYMMRKGSCPVCDLHTIVNHHYQTRKAVSRGNPIC